jgi:hypothetical protein
MVEVAVKAETLKRRKYMRHYGTTHRRERAAYHKAWRTSNPHKTRQYWLTKYGLTPAGYDSLLAVQNGHCALCAQLPEQEPRGVLSIDHDHETGHVRGLLCMRHNNGLGMLGDTESALMRVLSYIRSNKWQT